MANIKNDPIGNATVNTHQFFHLPSFFIMSVYAWSISCTCTIWSRSEKNPIFKKNNRSASVLTFRMHNLNICTCWFPSCDEMHHFIAVIIVTIHVQGIWTVRLPQVKNYIFFRSKRRSSDEWFKKILERNELSVLHLLIGFLLDSYDNYSIFLILFVISSRCSCYGQVCAFFYVFVVDIN